MDDSISETARVTVKTFSMASWEAKMAAFMKDGSSAATRAVEEGRAFEVAILAPHEVGGDAESIPLAAAILQLDWKLAKRREMVSSARDFISSAYICGSLDPALPTVFKSVIEGRGLYAYGVGEFFLLYGRFQQKYRVFNGKQTRARMMKLIGGDTRYLKAYIERGKERMDPLPYAVRNTLSHIGNNPNRLDPDGSDLKSAIELLRSWVKN